MNSIIYTFFEPGTEIPNIEHPSFEDNIISGQYQASISQGNSVSSSTESQGTPNTKKKKVFLHYKCKICAKNIKCQVGVNSNLCTHISTKKHETQKKMYDEWMKNKQNPKKNILIETLNNPNISASLNLVSMGAVTKSEKYKKGSPLQLDRYIRLMTMIVKCMLPISIVRNIFHILLFKAKIIDTIKFLYLKIIK